MDWYKKAQTQDLYNQLSDLGISFNEDGSLNIYGVDNDGNINFSKNPKVVENINKALSQQYIVYEALQDELHKYLAFLDDLVLLVEKLNRFPTYSIPKATEKIDEQDLQESISNEQDVGLGDSLEEDIIEESEEIENIEEDVIEQPYPFTPEDYMEHPQYGYWYYPFNPEEYAERTPEETQEDLKKREELQSPPFPEQDEILPPSDIPKNEDIIEEVEEDVSETQETSFGDAQNVANMIRRKYVSPLSNVQDELKVEIRDRFEEVAKAYEALRFSDTLNVINMATRIRIEKDLRNKFERILALIRRRIELMEEFFQGVKEGTIGYSGYIEDFDIKMTGYEVQRQGNNVFRVIKPGVQNIYYTDINNRVCTCPWGRKVSPYKYEASACKHYSWIVDLLRKNMV